eukprot:12430467-Alexandrium_andersonii.AAC.1
MEMRPFVNRGVASWTVMAGSKPPAQTVQTNETVLLINEVDEKNTPKKQEGARGKGRANSAKQ